MALVTQLSSVLKRLNHPGRSLNYQNAFLKFQPIFNLRRSIYTHRDTKIEGFETFLRSIAHEKRIPNFLESNPHISEEDKDSLYGAFLGVVEDVSSIPCVQHLPLGVKRTKDLMEYVVCLTPYFAAQCLMVHNFYAKQRMAQNPYCIQEEKDRHFLACKLAWALEFIVRSLFVMDDLLDTNVKRNGVPTWMAKYGKPAGRDASVLTMVGFCVLRKYFEHMDCYSALVDEAIELLYSIQIATNQFCELDVNPPLRPKLRKIAFEEMSHMQQGLVGPGVVTSAVTAAMIFNGYGDSKLIDTAKQIGYETMMPVTIFDDHLDCFGSTVVTGRASKDIIIGKQTWMLLKALELGSAKQFYQLQECYGRNDPNCVKEVMRVYKELHIEEITLEIGEAMAYRIGRKIDQLPQDIFPCFIWRFIISHYHGMVHGRVSRI